MKDIKLQPKHPDSWGYPYPCFRSFVVTLSFKTHNKWMCLYPARRQNILATWIGALVSVGPFALSFSPQSHVSLLLIGNNHCGKRFLVQNLTFFTCMTAVCRCLWVTPSILTTAVISEKCFLVQHPAFLLAEDGSLLPFLCMIWLFVVSGFFSSSKPGSSWGSLLSQTDLLSPLLCQKLSRVNFLVFCCYFLWFSPGPGCRRPPCIYNCPSSDCQHNTDPKKSFLSLNLTFRPPLLYVPGCLSVTSHFA